MELLIWMEEMVMNKLFRVFALILLGISISFIRATPTIGKNPNQTLETFDLNQLLQELDKSYKDNTNYLNKSRSIRSANNNEQREKGLILQDMIRFAENGLSNKMSNFFLDKIKNNNYQEISQFVKYIQGLESIDIEYFVNSDFETNLLDLYRRNSNKDHLFRIIDDVYNETIFYDLDIHPPIIKILFASDNPRIKNNPSLKMIRQILGEILRKEKFYKDKDEAVKKLTIDDAKRYLGKLFFTFYMDLVIIKLSSVMNMSAREDIKKLAVKFLELVPDKTTDQKKMYANLRTQYNIPSNNLVESVDQPDSKNQKSNTSSKSSNGRSSEPSQTKEDSNNDDKKIEAEPVEFGA